MEAICHNKIICCRWSNTCTYIIVVSFLTLLTVHKYGNHFHNYILVSLESWLLIPSLLLRGQDMRCQHNGASKILGHSADEGTFMNLLKWKTHVSVSSYLWYSWSLLHSYHSILTHPRSNSCFFLFCFFFTVMNNSKLFFFAKWANWDSFSQGPVISLVL